MPPASKCSACRVKRENVNLRETAQSLSDRRKDTTKRCRDLEQDNACLRDQVVELRNRLAFMPMEEPKEPALEPVWVN